MVYHSPRRVKRRKDMDMTTMNNRANEAINSARYHKAIDNLATEYNNVQNFNRTVEATAINVLAGYESKYMDKNDYRFAHKLAHKDSKVLANDEYFNYLAQSATGNADAQVRERKVVRESYDFDMTKTVDKLPWVKKSAKSAPTKVAIKKIKSIPSATYVPAKPQVEERDIEFTDEYTRTYKVLNYHWYQKAIILDLADVNKEREAYQNRELAENNEQPLHLVFRYMPYLSNGQPNEKDGITQLRNFLLSQKFIVEQVTETDKFKFIRQALDVLVGYTVDMPTYDQYTFASSDVAHIVTKNGEHKVLKTKTGLSDISTAFTVFGDFDTFEEQFTSSTQEYQNISEYSLIDKDAFGYENIKAEVYAHISNKYNPVISYDCHKEFVEPLPLVYNHIGNIFD